MGSLPTTLKQSGQDGRMLRSLTMQAKALAAFLSSTSFTKVLSSPLKRAMATAEALQQAQPASCPPVIVSSLLREQHFGIGEGKPYTVAREPGLSLDDHYAQGKFPSPRSRTGRFPEGESLEDVAVRAEQVIDDLLIPELVHAFEENQDANLAIISHGLFLGELLAALVKRRGGIPNMQEYRGLRNTAWSRVVVRFQEGEQPLTLNRARLRVHITHTNQYSHLNNLVRQKGGIGSASYDPKQKDIRAFFEGAASKERKR
ncbi:hypothetical protein AX16_008005 [Volvariella volvacea WC 439]|nr:hypothetical protein AX16_008005 [Volvariella volvacea WC 439]